MKAVDRFLKSTTTVVKNAVVTAAGIPSLGGVHQPKFSKEIDAFVAANKSVKA